jgi:hypothetical protein
MIKQSPEEFQAEETAEHARWLAERLSRELKRRGIGITDELFRSIVATAFPDGVDLSFLTYGRMRDMGAGKGYNKGRRIDAAKAASLRNKRKKNTFYSKTAWGGISRLVRRLQTTYTGQITERIKSMEDGI